MIPKFNQNSTVFRITYFRPISSRERSSHRVDFYKCLRLSFAEMARPVRPIKRREERVEDEREVKDKVGREEPTR